MCSAPGVVGTKFDLDRLGILLPPEGEAMLGPRRVFVRTPRGEWLALLCRASSARRGGREIILRLSKTSNPRGQDFGEEIVLVGPDQPALFETHGKLRGRPAILADSRGTLHLFWQEGRKIRQATFQGDDPTDPRQLRRFKAWMCRSILLPTSAASLSDALVDREGNGWVACGGGGVFVGRPGRSQQFTLASEQGKRPCLALGEDGELHLAYEVEDQVSTSPGEAHLDRRICYLRSQDGKEWLSASGGNGPDVAAHAIAGWPSMVLWRDRPLIAFLCDAVKKVKPNSREYLRSREGGGASVGYAFYDGKRWLRGAVARAREIIMKQINPIAPEGRYSGDIFPTVEEMGPPELVLDGHGVPWVFWMNCTRRYSYWARWMGESFSPPQEHRGAYYLPSGFLATGAGMNSLVLSVAAGPMREKELTIYFDSVVTPFLSLADDRRVMFLDLLEVAELDGLELRLNRMRKFEGNPVFEGGPPGSWDETHVTAPRVEYDATRARFRMFYYGSRTNDWQPGYAESSDGLAWERVETGVVELNGSRRNNRLEYVTWYRDEDEPDPSRRYKGFLFKSSACESAGFVVSPDAIHWARDESVPVEHTQLPFTEHYGISYRNTGPSGRGEYKAIGRTWHDSGRAVGMMYSLDLHRWHGAEHILCAKNPFRNPPSPRAYGEGILDSHAGPAWEDQIYYAFSEGPRDGIYLLFYAPCDFDCRYQLSLAVSRDGRHFTRVCGGEPILPVGEPGQWDNGFIFAGHASGPLPQIGDELRLYYGASGWHHGTEPYRPKFRIGFATQVLDRWTYLQVQRERDFGSLITIPIETTNARGRQLLLNVSALATGAFVQVEALDVQSLEPFPRYAKDECIPIVDEGVNVPVRWRSTFTFDELKAERFRLRFHLHGLRTRLYGFRFANVNP